MFQKLIFNDPKRFAFIAYIYFNSVLLKKATTDDWKRFYISIFNYGHFEWISILNSCILKIEEEKKNGLKEITKSKKCYPPNVFQLLDNHPNLKGFIRKNYNSKTIKTVEDLRSVNDTLEKGLKLLKETRNGKSLLELAEKTNAIMSLLEGKAFLHEKVEISKYEIWGFPKGTRFVDFMILPGYHLLLVKTQGKYKIMMHPSPY